MYYFHISYFILNNDNNDINDNDNNNGNNNNNNYYYYYYHYHYHYHYHYYYYYYYYYYCCCSTVSSCLGFEISINIILRQNAKCHCSINLDRQLFEEVKSTLQNDRNVVTDEKRNYFLSLRNGKKITPIFTKGLQLHTCVILLRGNVLKGVCWVPTAAMVMVQCCSKAL